MHDREGCEWNRLGIDRLGDILLRSANRFPTEPAIRYLAHEFDFQAIAAATADLADVISDQDSDASSDAPHRIAILVPNCPAFSVAYFATIWAGKIAVPMNPLLSPRELILQLQDCEAACLIYHSALEEKVREVLPQLQSCKTLVVDDIPPRLLGPGLPPSQPLSPTAGDPEQTAVVLYTSGSTGEPKGVELSHTNLLHNAWWVSEHKFRTGHQVHRLGPGEVGLAALPLSHSFGQTNLLNGMWMQGGCLSLLPKFTASSVIDTMIHQRVTFFAGVPTMYFELNEEGKRRALDSDSSGVGTGLKFCVCGGAPMPDGLKHEFSQRFGVPVQESYGLTETSPMVSFQRRGDCDVAGNVGRAIDDVEVEVFDAKNQVVPRGQHGEIGVRGPNTFRGYWRKPNATKAAFQNGWLMTGDIGCLDADGKLWIVERKSEVISRGGYQVYPREVETVLLRCEWVRQAVCLGVNDDRLGQEVVAVITLPDSERLKSSELRKDYRKLVEKHCQEQLATYKRPRRIEIMESLPLGSTGKVSRLEIRRRLESRSERGRMKTEQ